MSDDALINQFRHDRSESAFSALVQRHLQLVFGTALRQVGDRQLAEEIAQNVFLALARKAGRLGGFHTVAGWLYEATLREARLSLRTRYRRARREQVAMETGTLHASNDDNLHGLLPLLDEALAHLSGADRLAVILRYLEEKPWKEVGELLGVTEEAARKRADRALDALGQFFARHGFKITAGAIATGLTGQASAAVPHALAGAVTTAVVAKSASTSSLGILLGHLMNLTKTQTTVATLLVCAAPIAYEAKALRETNADQASLRSQLTALQATSDEANDRNRALQHDLASLDGTLASLAKPLPIAKPFPQRTNVSAQNTEGWQDNLNYVEVPKDLLKEIGIPSLNEDGRLRPEIIDTLAMTTNEVRAVQELIDTGMRKWNGLVVANAQYHPGFLPADLPNTLTNKPMLTYDFPALANEGSRVKTTFEQNIAEQLGQQRAELFLQQSGGLAQFTWNYGESARRVTLVRTGSPQSPVNLRFQFLDPDGTPKGTYSFSMVPGPDQQPLNLNLVPEFLQPVALNWYLDDTKFQ